MSGIEIVAYLVLGFILYRVGSILLFFRLALKVAKEMEEDPININETNLVKELREVAGDDFVKELHKKVHENE